MTYESLLYDVQDHVAVVTLNRPERLNALNGALQREVLEVCAEARADDDVRVVVITGAGRGFCSGADITGPRPQRTDEPRPQAELLDEFHWVGKQAKAVYGLDKPTIAAMNGVCAGAGMSLALCCDIRVGSEQARFRTMFIERNLSPDAGMTWLLTRIIGYSRTMDIVLTGRDVGGDDAYRLGLLDRLVPHESLMDETLALAGQITRWPPVAARASKRVIQQNLARDFEDGLRNEVAHLSVARSATNDARESFLARQEKREPRYTGT